MHKVERPGVDPTWAKGWGRVRKKLLSLIERNTERTKLELEHYAAHGTSNMPMRPPPPVSPPYSSWELVARSPLVTLSGIRIAQVEIAGMEGQFDRAKAVDAFAASCAHQIIRIHMHAKAPLRFPGRLLQTMSEFELPFLPLGVVLGCKEQAFRLARLQLLACRKQFYLDNRHFPIFHFILRVLADYLGEPPHGLAPEIAAEPIFTALFDAWRHPDPEVLLPLCLAACDFHTTRNKYGDWNSFYEFERDMWSHFPFEILMVFRLREYLGLANPAVDHPLMNTVLGTLPAEGSCETDDPILRATFERMQADGYDEVRIFDDIMATGNL